MDSLQLSVPVSCQATLTIAANPKDKNDLYHKDLKTLIEFWHQMEADFIGNEGKKVRAVGLCDVETFTLVELYKEVNNKPTGIAVIIIIN